VENRISSSYLRIMLIMLLLLGGYLFLLGALWLVQIQQGEEHRQRISKQCVRRIRIPAVRGRIISADNKVIADNQPVYEAVLHLEEMRQPGNRARTIAFIMDALNRIAVTVGRQNVTTLEMLTRHMTTRPGLPFVVYDDLTTAELAKLAELPVPPPGMEIIVVPQRYYPEGDIYAHVLGYTGPEDRKTADDRDQFFYYLPDSIGKSGLEAAYDKISDTPVPIRGLRGEPGGSMVLVDHRGYVFEVLDTEPAAHGNDLVTTLDSRAQKIAHDLMSGHVGAMILMDADTGAVLAMVSSPFYNPNSLSGGITADNWRRLVADSHKPLLNRVTQGAYTPGSIMKPLVALALLENHADISPVTCVGGTWIGRARLRCTGWKKGGHGTVDLVRALTVSCNDYFVQRGMGLGMEPIRAMMDNAGLGNKTGFCLPERSGMLPDRDLYYKLYHAQWSLFDTAQLSIGQGMILVTPLQVVTYISALANGGTLWQPYLLKEIRDFNGNVLYVNRPHLNRQMKLAPENLDMVRRGMREVVAADDGSGRKGACSKIDLYGKTGTGEVGPKNNRYNNTWFVGFGEANGHRYAITVFVDHGASGGSTCAPLAAEFFERWLP